MLKIGLKAHVLLNHQTSNDVTFLVKLYHRIDIT